MIHVFARLRAAAPPRPIEEAWLSIDPVGEAVAKAKIAKLAADAVGLFSLFALIAVFAEIAGVKTLSLRVAALGPWDNLDLVFHVPWLPFLISGAFGVWIFNRHGLRLLMALKGWRRGVEQPAPITKAALLAVLIGLFALIVVTATKFQTDGRQTDARAAAVTEQTAARDRAAVERDLARVQRDLDVIEQPADVDPGFQTQAARAGVEGWTARITAERARGRESLALRYEAELPTARRADDLRAERARLQEEMRTAPVSAATAATVAIDRGATGWISDLFHDMPALFAIAVEVLAIMMKFVEVLLLQRAQLAWAARGAGQAPPAAEAAALQPDPSPARGMGAPLQQQAALAAAESSEQSPSPEPPPEPDAPRGRRNCRLPAPTAHELDEAGLAPAQQQAIAVAAE